MPPSTKDKPSDVEATKMIRAANKLEKELPVSLGGDPDLVATIAQQISTKTARAAQNTAETMYLDSEIERKRKEKELNEVNNPKQSHGSGSPVSMFGGFGSGGRAAIIQSMLNSIPEDKRAEFVQSNKEMLLGGESPAGLLGLLGKAQGNGGNGHSGGFGPVEMAALITALGEESRQNMLMAQRMQPQQSQQQQPSNGVGQIEFVNLVRDIQAQNMQMINQVTQQFAGLVSGIQQQFRDLQDKHTQDSMNLRQQLMDAQRESVEKDKGYLMQRLEELQSQPQTPANVLTLNHLPLIKQALGEAGMKVSTENAATEESRRKWDLEDRRLDIEREERDRAYQRQIRHEELELAKANARASAFQGLVGLVGSAVQSAKVEKALKSGGSDVAKSVASVPGRFNE